MKKDITDFQLESFDDRVHSNLDICKQSLDVPMQYCKVFSITNLQFVRHRILDEVS